MVLSLVAALASGSLIIMGGGPEPESAIKRLIERAGGPKAKIVVLAQPHEEVSPSVAKLRPFFQKLGAENVDAPDSTDPKVILKSLENAKGVFLSGGNQFLFMTRFPESSGVPAAIRKVYSEGGVVSGTSAGASLLAEWMPGAKTPTETDLRRFPEGTEKGLYCLPGAIFDQHFLKRNRIQRMTQNLLSRPGTWGLGVDERGWCEIRNGVVRAELGQSLLFAPNGKNGFNIVVLNPGETANLPG